MNTENSASQQKIDKHIKQLAFFAALCMFLAAIEYAIPKPLPFLRLGLANLPVLLSLSLLQKKDFFFLIFLKIMCQALISGTLFSYVFLFSAAGSFTSGLIMFITYHILYRSITISYIGISMAGALGNNIIQIILARFIIFGTNTKYIAPVVLIAGCITGFMLGIFTNTFTQQSVWYKKLLQQSTAKKDF